MDNDAFRILSPAEFKRLPTREKQAYLKRAIEAHRLLTDQLGEAINQLVKAPPEDLK